MNFAPLGSFIKLPSGAKFTEFCPRNDKSTRFIILLFNAQGFKVQGSLLFVTYTIIQSIISSEIQVELKKNTALHEESEEKKITPRLCSLGSTV